MQQENLKLDDLFLGKILVNKAWFDGLLWIRRFENEGKTNYTPNVEETYITKDQFLDFEKGKLRLAFTGNRKTINELGRLAASFQVDLIVNILLNRIIT